MKREKRKEHSSNGYHDGFLCDYYDGEIIPTRERSPSVSSSPPRLGYIEHHVSKFDTLAGVAIKYGVEVADIKKMNNLVTDHQMFALKTLHIPLPGKHPPSPCFSNGSCTPGNSDHSPPYQANRDLLESFQSLRIKSSERKVSPAMSLLGYYGLKGTPSSSEDGPFPRNLPMSDRPLSHHRKSKSLVNVILEEMMEKSNDSLAAETREIDSNKWNDKPVKRCQKSLADFTRIPELLLREDNSSNGVIPSRTGRGLALRQNASSRTAMTSDSEPIVPSLTDTLHEIPVLAYWTISTLVTCTSYIDFLGDKNYRYDLSKFDYKLEFILKNFKDHEDKCNTQIGRIKDYLRRKDIINSIETDTQIDIVKFLEALIIPSDSQYSRPTLYNGLTGGQAGIGEFKNKYVLLFISGLDHIENEIQLLKSIDEKLKEEPKELEGYRKEDFKILWIPIVSVWDEEQKKKLDATKVMWYVVKEFNFQTGIDLIKEVFNYNDNPIIMLISPEGKVENPDAKQIISKWGIDGFPFRKSDHTRLTQQWNWFWTEMNSLSPTIRELIKRDSYIFIYGGSNIKWIQDFTTAVEKLKKNETDLSLEDTRIESYALGSDSPKIVPRFWITIDNLLASRKQTTKGGEEVQEDSTTREIKKLLLLKQDPHGWAILTRGSQVKLLGHGEAMLRTVAEFGSWKGTLNSEVSFDAAFKVHYKKCKDKTVPQKCEHREFANYPTDILAHIPCPNKCGHEMEVASVKYMCCHGHETNDFT